MVTVLSKTVLARRRAARYAQLLDEAAGGRRHHVRSSADSDLTELVALSHRVSRLPLAVEVDPAFRSGLRANLMARIERDGIGVTARETEPDTAPRRRLSDLLPSTRVRGAMIVTLAAGTLAVSGVSAASGDAIPGDTLYGVKRSTEKAKLTLATNEISRGQLHLAFARKRLGEAQAIRNDPAALRAVMDEMDRDVRQGTKLLTVIAIQRGDAAGLQAVEQFVAGQRPELAAFATRLGGPSRTRANESLRLLDDVGRRASALRTNVACPDTPSQIDALGAVPRACAHAAGPAAGPADEAAPQATPRPTGNGVAPAGAPSADTPAIESSSPSAPPSGEPDPGLIDKVVEGLLGR